MPMTYDQRGLSLLEDFGAADPVDQGAEIYSNGAFRRVDAQGVYDPRTAWVNPHWTMPLLAHLVSFWAGSTAVAIVTTGQPFPSAVTAYYDAGQTKKAAQALYTRNALQQATQVVTTVYAPDGVTVAHSCTDTISYAGGYETARTRVAT